MKILKSSLTKTGGMNVMVYAKYARTSVYQLQHLLKMTNNGEEEMDQELRNSKKILASLPPSSWVNRHKAGVYNC